MERNVPRSAMGRFPGNKRFAFTVFDDTDYATVENVRPVYRLLAELGLRTTKSVWPLPPVPGAPIGGTTLHDRAYLEFVGDLQKDGFEIGLHNVQNHDAVRKVTSHGIDRFRDLVGHEPRTHCNHHVNRENIYWGAQRISGTWVRLGYNLATRFGNHRFFRGHDENSPYFWGDMCRNRISYVRNFVFDEINLDRINPTTPYHDPARPYVNFWFSSSEGGTVESFCRTLGEENQDRLAAEGGVCIMYTHFAAGFCDNGALHDGFERLMRRLARMNGWFVPVGSLLDHLKEERLDHTIPRRELAAMERRWFFNKLRTGTT